MEPHVEGFCELCNAYSDWLVIRVCRNLLTGTIGVHKCCPECRERFNLDAYRTSPSIGGDSDDRIGAEGENYQRR